MLLCEMRVYTSSRRIRETSWVEFPHFSTASVAGVWLGFRQHLHCACGEEGQGEGVVLESFQDIRGCLSRILQVENH